MSLGRLPVYLLPLVCAISATGCEWIFIANVIADDGDDYTDDYYDDVGDCIDGCGCGPCPPGTTTGVGAVAPAVELTVADFPPIGPDGEVTVTASSPNGLARADALFKLSSSKRFDSALTTSLAFTGSDLGEGMGTLRVDVFGTDTARTTSFVDNLLVDLSPPQAFLEGTIVTRADGGEAAFYVGDAWVLGGWSLTVAGETTAETFPAGYPSTLGTEWDYSYVSVPLPPLPAGKLDGALEVVDAAGNVASYTVSFDVDGLAPTALFDQPAAGAVQSDTFDVVVQAVDDLAYPTQIELFVAGTSVVTAPGPTLTVTLDARDFVNGAVALTAIATDLAGNESLVATRPITIAHP